MRQEVRWYLTERLAAARAALTEGGEEHRQRTLAFYQGSLAAFRYLEELSPEEWTDWNVRMLQTLGAVPSHPVEGVSQAVYVGEPGGRQEPPDRPPVPRFVRSVPGPDAELVRHGGRLRVLAVDLYDTTVEVRWRCCPPPDVAADEPIAGVPPERDGHDDRPPDELHRRGMELLQPYRFALSDDGGTVYAQVGGGHGTNGVEATGTVRFAPAPPSTASMLLVAWLDGVVEVPLRMERERG